MGDANAITLCKQAFMYILVTLPVDLIPLMRHSIVTIHAASRHRVSCQLMLPKSSIPLLICNT